LLDRKRFASGRPLTVHETAALGPFFPGFDLGKIRVQEGLPWFAGAGTEAMTLGNRIYVTGDRPDSAPGIALLAHEITHSSQYARDGWTRFLARYASAYLSNRLRGMRAHDAYRAIPDEVEAFAMGSRVAAHLASASGVRPGRGESRAARCRGMGIAEDVVSRRADEGASDRGAGDGRRDGQRGDGEACHESRGWSRSPASESDGHGPGDGGHRPPPRR
jgi:hypothetical protein